MDIKKKIDEIVDKVKNDKDFEQNFKDNPVQAVETIIGVDLPDDKVKPIVDGVKAKIGAGKIGRIFDKFM